MHLLSQRIWGPRPRIQRVRAAPAEARPCLGAAGRRSLFERVDDILEALLHSKQEVLAESDDRVRWLALERVDRGDLIGVDVDGLAVLRRGEFAKLGHLQSPFGPARWRHRAYADSG